MKTVHTIEFENKGQEEKQFTYPIKIEKQIKFSLFEIKCKNKLQTEYPLIQEDGGFKYMLSNKNPNNYLDKKKKISLTVLPHTKGEICFYDNSSAIKK